MLSVEKISSGYGMVQVLQNCSLEINEGEIVSIIGANGVGKSTLVNTISGLVRCVEGQISWLGEDITALPSNQRVKAGIVQVPEGRQIFAEFTVEENLKLGSFTWVRKKDRSFYHSEMEKIYQMFPILYERRNQKAGTMSGGEQQMLAIGRALMSQPKLIMLDEPSLGLAPKVVYMMFDVIRELNERFRLPILLIEQDAEIALEICDRGYVMESGRIVLNGTGKELANEPKVKEIYLGMTS